MKPTSVNALKAAVQRTLHPPLPLDARQSQRLINLISASFRKKLNEEHHQPAAPQPVDTHLQAILTNPLFRQSPHTLRGRQHSPGSPVHPKSAPRPALSLQEFSEHCARGTATLHEATALLRSVPSSGENYAEGRSRVDAALQWLWSSGFAESVAFVESRLFVSVLTRALAAVDRVDVLWKLEHITVKRYMSDLTQNNHARSRGLSIESASPRLQQTLSMATLFWQTRFKMAQSIDDCAREFLRIQSCPIANEQWQRWMVKKVSYRFVAELLERSEPEVISADLYHQLTRHPAFYKAMSTNSQASLALFAPIPDASAAYELLNQELSWLLMPSTSPKNHKRRALLAIRTINVLLDQNRPQQAALIGSLVVKYLWQDSHSTDPSSQASEESRRLPSFLRDLISSQLPQFSPESG